MAASQTALRRNQRAQDQSAFVVRRPVIIADDSQDDRALLSRFLDSFVAENTPVIALGSGRELVHYFQNLERSDLEFMEFQKEIPSMVFLDLFMPKMNGIETLKALRSRTLWLDVPVTLVTNSCDDISIRRAQNAGANAFLPKPFTKLDVMKAMQKAHNFSFFAA